MDFSSASILSLVAAVCTGLSVFSFLSVFAFAAVAKRPPDSASLLERQRIGKLRKKSIVYRLFEPLILDWLKLFGTDSTAANRRLQQALDADFDGLPWMTGEFQACQLVSAIIVGTGFAGLGGVFYGPAIGIVVAVIVGGVMFFSAGNTRLEKLKTERTGFIRRLPFSVDLLALMMEAGATFPSALRTLVHEESGHAVGRQFAIGLKRLDHGETLRASLENLKERVSDEEDVAEFVFAVVKGKELGTPMAEILRNQADQMRLKRSQRAEKASADAQVKMTWPGFVIMLVCMAIISGPFIMNFLQTISAKEGAGLFD